MIKFEHTKVYGWEAAIRGMRNPMNSWSKSDSYDAVNCGACGVVDRDGYCDPSKHRAECEKHRCYNIGPNDHDLMMRLRNAGPSHRKFMRMITVSVDITAPLYWWKEFDTYKIGTVANSCSTMHKIHAKEFTLDDFSYEHLVNTYTLEQIIKDLNFWRNAYLIEDDSERKEYISTRFDSKIVSSGLSRKDCWWQMIQLLPSSYNQKRTITMTYEVLANMWDSGRKNHKLDEWAEHDLKIPDSTIQALYSNNSDQCFGFCDWIKTLLYSELITGIVPTEKEEV